MEEDNYFFDIAEHIKTSTPRSPYTRIDIAAYEPHALHYHTHPLMGTLVAYLFLLWLFQPEYYL